MTYLPGLMVIIVHIVMMHVCNFTCPHHKPYCSSVGCVFECLNPFYINGTDCVTDCGHFVVDQNRHCIESCPAESFIMESLQLVNGNQYLEKSCVQCNVTEGFIQNDECFKRCPENWKYTVDGNHARCMQECPAEKVFTSIVQRFGVFHNQCVSECSDPFYTNNNSCVTLCGHFFLDDQTRHCVETCASDKFIMGKNCVLCDKYGEFIIGNECVHSCQDGWNFIQEEHHAKCLQDCPLETPLKNRVNILSVEHSQCVANCTNLVDDEYCVTSCPNGKVQSGKYCVNNCPLSALYVFNGKCYSGCPTSDINLISDNFTCVEICPYERPYIMNNSCVSSCPDLIRHNKYCVDDCGENDMLLNNSCLLFCPSSTVAFNKTCMEKCPDESKFSCGATISQEVGRYPIYIYYQTCVNRCPGHMFVWKNTCLYECPCGIPSFGQECTDECPIYSPYQITFHLKSGCDYDGCDNIQEVLKCIAECPDNTFMYNNTCSFYCPSGLFQFEKNCITKCPDNSSLQINSTLSISVWERKNVYINWRYYSVWKFQEVKEAVDHFKCVSSCGASHVLVNNTCKEKCPESAPFVHNRVCKNYKCTTKYVEHTEIGIVCIESCDGYILENNNTCNKRCPPPLMVYNRSCVASCPNNRTYIVQSTYSKCESRCSPEELRLECVEECPTGTFTKHNYCVNFCELPLYTFQTECVSTCPLSAQYFDESTIKVSVWQKYGYYIQLKLVQQQIRSCVVFCPSNKVLYDGICSESCPLHSGFIRNQTCTNKTCDNSLTYTAPNKGIVCFDKCPDNMLQYNQTCVNRCPTNQRVFESACVAYCPQSAQFTSEEPRVTDLYNCKYFKENKCSSELHTICKKECPVDQYIEDKKCVPHCSDGLFTFEKICLNKCPDVAPYVQLMCITVVKWSSCDWCDDLNSLLWRRMNISTDQRMCVTGCSDVFLKFGNTTTCIENCKEPFPLHFNDACVASCPSGTLLDGSRKRCVKSCFSDTSKFNGVCYKNCPEHVKFTFNSECVAKCPDSAPFGLKSDGYTCRKSCEDDKLFKDGDCINKYECDDPWFEFAGACIERCPTGFVWFNSCISTTAMYVSIGILAAMFIFVSVCLGQFLWNNFQVIVYIWDLQGKLQNTQSQIWCRNESRPATVDAKEHNNIYRQHRYYLNKQYTEDDIAPSELRKSEPEIFNIEVEDDTQC